MWAQLWGKVVAWFKSKGGVAHVLAGAYAFAVAADAAVPEFHQALVNVWNSLPSWASHVILIGVGLWGFYKTWKKAIPPDNPPGA